MKKRFLLTSCLLLLALVGAYAQIKISGFTRDNLGEPLPAVNVMEKGTTNGVISDVDGKYEIVVNSPKSVLEFSFIGFETQVITVGNQRQITVALKENSVGLDEVVVVSFGTQKKRTMTGAVTSVKAEETKGLPVTQFAQGLQGKVSGVQIYQSSGKPGEGMSFRIRGAGSLNSGNTPLFVVDGMPITTEISNISPDEIESFSVLKDASASSLYGSRAANGVILITTKKAQKGKTSVEFSANVGLQTINESRLPDMMNGTEYAQWKKNYYEDMIKYTGWKDPQTGKSEVPAVYRNPEQYGEGTNWFDKITRDALIQNYGVTISSGNDKLKSTVVASYANQEGMLINTGYERFNFRVNTLYTPTEKIRLGVNLAPSYRKHENQNTDGGWSTIACALYAPPIIPFYNADGSMPEVLSAVGSLKQPNPYLMLTRQTNVYKGTRILGNAFLEVDVWKGLTWKSTFSIDAESSNHRIYKPIEASGEINAVGTKSTGTYQTGFQSSWVTEHTLTYNGKIGEHNFDLLGGFSAQKYRWEGSGLYGENFADDYPWLNQAEITKMSGSNTPTAWAMASFLARANYNYKEKYLLQVALREDGCSRFGADNRWGLFPSLSAGWIVSEESFMKKASNVLNYLKLRVSYGLTGNNNIGDYTYAANVANINYVFNGGIQSGTYLSGLENKLLGWEITKQLDFGIDFGLFNDRIYVQTDYWRKTTSDMLYQMTLPYSSGYGSIQTNVGKVRFWGADVDIETRNLVGAFKWSTNLNLSFSKNKVLSLGEGTDHLGGDGDYGGSWNRTEVGKPLGFLYGYVYDGVFMNEEELAKGPVYADSDASRKSVVGSPRMKDISGPDGKPDGIITREDRTMIGDPLPDMMFGMTNTFKYKNFDLGLTISGSIGGDLVIRSMEYSHNLDGSFNMSRELLDCWRSEENPGNGRIPRAAGNAGVTYLARDRSSLMVYDGSYLAFKNLTIGYTFPKMGWLEQIRVYASFQNLGYITSYPGPNPESSANGTSARYGGIDDNSYPIPRTYSLGVNIKF